MDGNFSRIGRGQVLAKWYIGRRSGKEEFFRYSIAAVGQGGEQQKVGHKKKQTGSTLKLYAWA